MHYALTACVAASAAALSCLPLKAAQAEPILYTETTTASGTLGSKSFKDRPLTVHYLGDTANVASPVPTLIQDTGGVATFYISDVGAGAFTGGQAVALLFKPSNGFAIGANSTNPNLLPGGNGAGGNAQGVILGTSNPALAGYGMINPIGPLTGPGVLQSSPAAGGNGTPVSFATTSGNLTLLTVGTVTLTVTLVNPNNGEENNPNNGGNNGNGERSN